MMISLMMGPAAVTHSSLSLTPLLSDKDDDFDDHDDYEDDVMMITRWRNVVDLNFMWVEAAF